MAEKEIRKDLSQCKVCKKVYFLTYLKEHLQTCHNDKVIHKEEKRLQNVHEGQKIPKIVHGSESVGVKNAKS